MSKRLLVLGRGYLGSKFEKMGHETWGREVVDFPLNMTSFRDDHTEILANEILGRVEDSGADAIVNCIGKADTRWCEDPRNSKKVYHSNVVVPALLSQACAILGKKFVHVSTGCLYDKEGVANTEDTFLVAHCTYTASKFMAEHAINPLADLMIRPRLYFGDEIHQKNLICKLKRFDRYLDNLNSYSSLKVIVESVQALVDADQCGAFNVACDGSCSIRDLAAMCGLHRKSLDPEVMRKEQGLYLVNNVMSIQKLKQFYRPPQLENEVRRCLESMNWPV